MLDCIISIGILCTNLGLEIEIQEPRTIQHALIKTQNELIVYELKTDYIGIPELKYMDIACEENGLCIYYHRYCFNTNQEFLCNYTIVFPGEIIPNRFTISAKNNAGLEKISSEIYIQKLGDVTRRITVSSLTKNSKFSAPVNRGRNPINKSVKE